MTARDEAQSVSATLLGSHWDDTDAAPSVLQPAESLRVFWVDPVLLPLMDGYLRGRAQDVATMALALDTGDWPAIRKAGHSMHGSGASYGIPPISEFGDALEQAADAQDHASVRGLLVALAAFLTHVRVRAEPE